MTANLSNLAKICPLISSEIVFNEEEWKILYCCAGKTKEIPRPLRKAFCMLSLCLSQKFPLFPQSTPKNANFFRKGMYTITKI